MWGIWDIDFQEWVKEFNTEKRAFLAFAKKEEAMKRAVSHFGYDSYDEVVKDGHCEVRPFYTAEHFSNFTLEDVKHAIASRLDTLRKMCADDDFISEMLAKYCIDLCNVSAKNFLLKE